MLNLLFRRFSAHRPVAGILALALPLGCGGPPGPTRATPIPPSISSSAVVASATPPPGTSSALEHAGDWEIRWDRGFAGWWPTIFDGKLTLTPTGDGWSAALSFEQSRAKFRVTSAKVEADRFELHVVAGEGDKDDTELWGTFHDGRFVGEMRWGNAIGWTPIGGRRFVKLARHTVDHSLPAFDLTTSGVVDRTALQGLVDKADDEHSSALVVMVDGKIGLEMYRDGYDGSPLVAMSASKSIVSLAVGMLIADGKLKLETKMGDIFPEWKKQGAKASITIQQLMTQTSGLDPSRADFQHQETIRNHALNAKLVFKPGTRFQYNNGGVDFLAVVVAQVAGMPLDQFLETRLFQKMDMVDAHWLKDSEGTPRGAGELFIRPVDLAKLGQLMLDGGVWQGTRVLPADWIDKSVAIGTPHNESYGLLWWREGKFDHVLTDAVLSAWSDAGVDAKTVKLARPFMGQKYDDWNAYHSALEKALGADVVKDILSKLGKGDHIPFDTEVADGPARGFSARGWLGQYLVDLPGPRVVAVRMRKQDGSDQGGEEGSESHGFRTFPDVVAHLFPAKQP